jgi:hypothetical protein
MEREEMLMVLTIRAHFDGRVIVPDEPLDLPVDQVLRVDLTPISPEMEEVSIEERRAALRRVVSRRIHGLSIPDEALRREHLYDERR